MHVRGTANQAFDRSIDVRISRLRQKLRDDPHNPRLIRTIYGAGYLFASAVEWRKQD
jgi:DNA-binding response OmpR family regulator